MKIPSAPVRQLKDLFRPEWGRILRVQSLDKLCRHGYPYSEGHRDYDWYHTDDEYAGKHAGKFVNV